MPLKYKRGFKYANSKCLIIWRNLGEGTRCKARPTGSSGRAQGTRKNQESKVKESKISKIQEFRISVIGIY
jgi:hypothetical protein